ncbi:MAG: 4Fe-4S binding protein [Nitratireductor sp.]|nr:4Fe-4S binding protein [Nitratireductor sp.]
MTGPKLVLCNCLSSQSLDPQALEKATGLACGKVHSDLCGAEREAAARAISEGDAIIACRQEQLFFEELATEIEAPVPSFVDLRDRAGWSADTRDKSPKMAALVAGALVPVPPVKTRDVVSAGTCLILGETEAALAAAVQLCELLAVTVLLPPGAELPLVDDRRFDIVMGKLAGATGTLGGFAVSIDALQQRIAGGRGTPAMTEPRDGARSECDILLDFAAGKPLFAAHEKREGYLRVDPGNLQARIAAILEASQLVGTFEKPLYLRLNEPLCAHSRAARTGCTRCLDLCPTGALAPDGDHVAVDAMVCAGCGACAAACPSAAIAYDAPPAATVFQRIAAMASAWRKLSKDRPRLLVHDGGHGAELIRLSARYGRGLPADVVPMEVAALAAFGHAEALSALASGFSSVTILLSPATERDGMPLQADLANTIAGHSAVSLIEPADPDALEAGLEGEPQAVPAIPPVTPVGSRRQVTRLAAKALNPPDAVIVLPAGAPYGTLKVDTGACTLCLSCVSLCPSGALGENPDRPQLRFQEDACLQCGICRSICPESAIVLEPRLNLADDALRQNILHEEEPFACIECGKPFGVRSTILKVTEKLAGKHAMFANKDAVRMIQMCDDCRVNAAYHSRNNPFAAGERPRVRTTDDYLDKRRDR